MGHGRPKDVGQRRFLQRCTTKLSRPPYPACGPYGPSTPSDVYKAWPKPRNYPVEMVGHHHVSQGIPARIGNPIDEQGHDACLEWGGE
eukprot:5071992-Karenia_brevis.AAC.1